MGFEALPSPSCGEGNASLRLWIVAAANARVVGVLELPAGHYGVVVSTEASPGDALEILS